MSAHCADELCQLPRGHGGDHELRDDIATRPCQACGVANITRAQGDTLRAIRERYAVDVALDQASDDVATLLGLIDHMWAHA